MTQSEYDKAKQECKEDLRNKLMLGNLQGDLFSATFNRSYSLGKVKDLISQDEIDEAAEDYVSFEKGGKCYPNYAVERACCRAFKDGANYALGKQQKTIAQEDIEKAAEAFATPPVGNGGMFTRQQVKGLLVKFAQLLPGKREKDAKETPISERLFEEEKSQLEGLYYYLNRKADEQENDCVSVAVLFEAMERLEDMFGIDLLTNGHGKPTPNDADTVIQGWAARDEDGNLFMYSTKPERFEAAWIGEFANFSLRNYLFPDLTWDDEPEHVEIIIKRKKK